MDKYDARGIVGLLRSERQLVAGDIDSSERIEQNMRTMPYMEVMESER